MSFFEKASIGKRRVNGYPQLNNFIVFKYKKQTYLIIAQADSFNATEPPLTSHLFSSQALHLYHSNYGG
ncbi:hypothetical protein XBKB1_1240026 [Xenorhabdus bovienii str. kraussei Becker Underwood]|uniref:Uncharacterized protein n=1 Tax=Xenorhabdus bovienii str. kraussei Becker Underwood TaxID=1398204 RepID=A0A077PRV3_XENBV|nr:hypothetical protein XBKB1_1240026 [Xenorhabdus bovienii str. kraussei Becker Underwood]